MVKRDFKLTDSRALTKGPRSDSPGPGNYNPVETFSRLSAPKFGFGTDTKLKNYSKFNGPGPNSYNINDKLARKSFQSTGMGYGKKMDPAQVLVDTPGPGSYVTFTFNNL